MTKASSIIVQDELEDDLSDGTSKHAPAEENQGFEDDEANDEKKRQYT